MERSDNDQDGHDDNSLSHQISRGCNYIPSRDKHAQKRTHTFLEKFTAAWTAIAAITAVIGGVTLYRQFGLTRRALEMSNRARLTIEGIDIFQYADVAETDGLTIGVGVINTGSATASKISVQADSAIVEPNAPFGFELPSAGPGRMNLGKDQSMRPNVRLKHYDTAQWRGAMVGPSRLFLYGTITYCDGFWRRGLTWCARLDHETKNWFPCEVHNDPDEGPGHEPCD